MVGFFAILDALFDLLRLPKQERGTDHCRNMCVTLSNFFDLVRS
jgi:hypothetical protein